MRYMDILDMDRYEERIKKYAVRLDDSIEVGSGFLFAPQEKNFIYFYSITCCNQYAHKNRNRTNC